MSRKTSAVAGGDTGTVDQYNFVRDEARASAWLLASETSTLKLYVHDSVVYFRDTKVEFSGGLTPVMSAPANSSRIDVVSMASSSEIVITSGVEADSPSAPTLPADHMPICEVYNRAGQVEITDDDEAGSNGYINKDTRKFLNFEKDSSLTEKGILEEATAAEINAGTQAGGTAAELAVNPKYLKDSEYYSRRPTANEKLSLAGTGTPGSGNEYVTDDDTTATPTANKVVRYNADAEIDGVDKIKDSLTYGETIAGDTLAVPVYQDTSDNKIYKCDADTTSKINFLGFAIEDGNDTDSKYVQLVGIVKGFSGLDEGKKYYVTNTAGSIGLNGGTYRILVGQAISATELFIIKNKRIITGTFTDSVVANNATTTSDTDITIDFLPKRITVFVKFGNGSAASNVMSPHYNNIGQPATPSYYINGVCIGWYGNKVSNTIADSSTYLGKWQFTNSPENYNALSIQTIDNTKITFRLTHSFQTASPNTGHVLCRYIIEE